MKSIGISVLILVLAALIFSASVPAEVQHRQHVHRKVRHHTQKHAHSVRPAHRYYVVKQYRTKLQHAKIIAGPAKTGASVGGLIGGPPGAAVGAAAGAATGTAYDVKTRKKKVYK